jgi:hypothetical protein
MKFICTLLVTVIVLHTQCLASCFATHLVSTAATNSTPIPPCHGHQGPKAPAKDHSPDHDDNACGFGSVTQSKTTLTLENTIQIAPPLPIDPPPMVEEAASMAFVPSGSSPPSAFLLGLKLKLRI